jgi:hypothetical protein
MDCVTAGIEDRDAAMALGNVQPSISAGESHKPEEIKCFFSCLHAKTAGKVTLVLHF